MRRALALAAILLMAAACRQARHPHPELTVEEPEALRPEIDASNPADEGQLLEGFHAREPAGWRWSAPEFAVALAVPAEARGRGGRLEFEFILPEVAARDLEGLTITAKIRDRELAAWRAPGPGTHTAVFPVPAPLLEEQEVIIDFSLSRFIPPRGAETRRLGVIPSRFRLSAADQK